MGPCTLSRRASPASRLCMPRPPGECQKALVGKGHTLYKGEIQGGGTRGRKRAPNKVGRQSAETYRSKVTREQKERRCREGTGERNGGQQGNNEGGQANRPRPHVSMKETRKLREKPGSQPTQGNQAQGEGGRDSGVGGGKRAESEGNARQERSAASAGHPKPGGRGRELQ